MDHLAERVRIPYEGTALAGYLYAPDDSGTSRPTIVMLCGYDSTAEYGWVDVPPALERGYAVLVVEGPGQGGALIDQGLPMRPDFENVLTPVLDWLLARPEVDPDAVVLFGRSFAGYLAPRAAAFEHRIAALVCDPAQPEMADRLPKGPAARLAAPVVRLQMRRNPRRREFFGARMATHGLTDVGAYFAELRRYSMLSLADRITCPTLVVEAEGDFAGGSGAQLIEAMIAPTELVRLTALPRCARSAQRVSTLCEGAVPLVRSQARSPPPRVPTATAAGSGSRSGPGPSTPGCTACWPGPDRQRRPAARVCSKIRFVSVEATVGSRLRCSATKSRRSLVLPTATCSR
jgi:pimeloyl-ACP methyl ester carboxylesterase